MKKSRKVLITVAGIIAVIISIPILLLALFVAPFVALHIFTPNPPKPEITYAEFPFEIVYEIDGEIITVTDVYVCEFDGFAMNKGSGKKIENGTGISKAQGKKLLYYWKMET